MVCLSIIILGVYYTFFRVYLAVAGLGIVLNILFLYGQSLLLKLVLTFDSFCPLPEITEDALAEEIDQVGIIDGQGPFWKQYRCVFGFIAQTAYVYVYLILSILCS